MPLQPIAPTEVVAGNQVAQRIIQEITQLAARIDSIRTDGIPAVAATPAGTHPTGQTYPARPATAGISAAVINAALGAQNCELLDDVKALLES